MSAIESIAGRFWLVLCLFGYLLLMVCTGPVLAQSESAVPAPSHDEIAAEISGVSTGVWLVTYGPGEIYWQ
ncbi:MAG TPA: hypothetical protein VJN01_14280, partial [Xanthomonadales bacterium]|nr:hypothetical protein [Xanthomonadales bacterium]